MTASSTAVSPFPIWCRRLGEAARERGEISRCRSENVRPRVTFPSHRKIKGYMTVMDQSHFEVLWSDAAPRVRAFLAAACRDKTLVDDFVQEVAMTAWRKRSEFNEARQFDSWVIGMARFVVLRHGRDLARQRVLLAPDLVERLETLATADKGPTDEKRQALAACVEALGEAARTLLGKRYQEGVPLAEVAQQLGRSHGAIRTALSRLRDSLRQCIQERLKAKCPDKDVSTE